MPTEEELEMKRRERERDAGLRVTVSRRTEFGSRHKANAESRFIPGSKRLHLRNKVSDWSNGGQSKENMFRVNAFFCVIQAS